MLLRTVWIMPISTNVFTIWKLTMGMSCRSFSWIWLRNLKWILRCRCDLSQNAFVHAYSWSELHLLRSKYKVCHLRGRRLTEIFASCEILRRVCGITRSQPLRLQVHQVQMSKFHHDSMLPYSFELRYLEVIDILCKLLSYVVLLSLQVLKTRCPLRFYWIWNESKLTTSKKRFNRWITTLLHHILNLRDFYRVQGHHFRINQE